MQCQPLLLGSILALGCAHPARRPPVQPASSSAASENLPEPRDDEPQEGTLPKPHDCLPLPAGSPLRVLLTPVLDDLLQTRALLFGCPSDVRLRPDEQSGISIQFGCPGSTEPTIVLRGHGSVPFPVLDPAHEYQRETTELYKVKDVIGRLPEKRFFYGLRKDPIPRCASKPLGLVVVITDYRRLDFIAERLTRWILDDDLGLEVIIELVPPKPPDTLMRRNVNATSKEVPGEPGRP